eukprot:s1874_g20.t1
MALEALHPATFALAADISRAPASAGEGGRLGPSSLQDRSGRRGQADPKGVAQLCRHLRCHIHFTRHFGAVVRCAQSLVGRKDLFQLTYVDDLLFLARGLGGMAGIWLCLLFFVIVGTPFSWHKFGGGLRAEWIGDSKDRSKCRWFSVKLDRRNAPWVFESGEPYRAIASLELLGALASLVAFKLPSGSGGSFYLSAGTDNLGNRHLVSRLLTTKFPLCVVLMQLAWTLHKNDLEMRLDWLPRLQNKEADALTNGDFTGFHDSLRVEIQPGDLLEDRFQELMDRGGELYDEVKELRRKRKEGMIKSFPSNRKLKGSSLIGPW